MGVSDIENAELNRAVEAVREILKRGNDAEVRRKGNGFIVMEVKKTIKYTAL